jgi:hypothetical protein
MHLQLFELIDRFLYNEANTFIQKNELNIDDPRKKFKAGGKPSDDNTKYKVMLKTNQQTQFFNTDQKQILDLSKIKKGQSIVFLFITKGIFLDELAINYRWTAKEVMVL